MLNLRPPPVVRRIVARAVALLGLLLAGCATVAEAGWQATLANGIEDRAAEFAAGAQILAGFEPVEPGSDLAVGDTLLYGIRLDTGGAPRIWYLRIRLEAIFLQRRLEMRMSQPFESQITTVLRRQQEEAARIARAQQASGAPARDFFEEYGTELPVARIQVEAFDQGGASLGVAVSEESVRRLRIGVWSACLAGNAQRDLLHELEAAEPSAAVRELDEATYADMEAVAEGIASCQSFMAILRQNPVTRGILYEVIALPSLWSIVANFGVRPGFGIDFAGALRVAAELVPGASGEVWSVPMTVELNDQPALLGRLLAAPTNGPAAAGAGVYGLVGRHPTDARRRVHVQLLASRRAEPR